MPTPESRNNVFSKDFVPMTEDEKAFYSLFHLYEYHGPERGGLRNQEDALAKLPAGAKTVRQWVLVWIAATGYIYNPDWRPYAARSPTIAEQALEALRNISAEPEEWRTALRLITTHGDYDLIRDIIRQKLAG